MYNFWFKAIVCSATLLMIPGWLILLGAQVSKRCGVGDEIPEAPPSQVAILEETPLSALSEQVASGRQVVRIPVVVHVVWNKPEENIPDEQIFSQIEALNRDFRALNAEIPAIPAVFQSRIADVGIEFCLATRTPDGKPTNGIVRTYTPNNLGIGGTQAIHYTQMGGADAWDPQQYLNIWVAKFAGGIGGVASFPNQGHPLEDGVEIDYRQFGTVHVSPPYHLGRTCTHEIGHYLNLHHVWGPNINSCCNEDDGIADTPNACETYLHQCPVHPVFSCTTPDMFMNYMFFTDDACMGMFTKGQKDKIWETLQTTRAGLLNSSGCLAAPNEESIMVQAIRVHGNPARDYLSFGIQSASLHPWQVVLTDLTGRVWWAGFQPSNQINTLQLNDIPAGFYWLTASDGVHRMVTKVVVF